VTGFAKAYHKERPAALVKAVDVAPSRKTAALADLLIEETLRDPGCVEVGHGDGRRWGIGLIERPFGDGSDGLRLGPETVFLVTGAAGSIVSAITADLATASGGTFHLLDLTPEPDEADADLRRYATDRDGLKTDLAARLKAAGERPTPVAIERELARLERAQAALAAIQAVRAAGGSAYYHSVDLTDEKAVAEVLADVRATSGRIDVLLHAAGVEVSHPLPDKSPAEFDLVFGVKADGWHNLLRGAGDLPIGVTVVFGSVAGRFGNTGQADYSAANDLLCKLTSGLRRTRPQVRALALDWTAWAGIGMATRGSIPKIMELAGVELLPPEEGVPWIRRELTGGPARGEVLVAGALGALAAEPEVATDVNASGPMLTGPVTANVHRGLTVHTAFAPRTRPFLDHHRIDDTPVLPGVMGVEAFAEVARILVPDWHVAAVTDVDFHAPVKFYRDEPRTLSVSALVHPDGPDLVAECALAADRTLPGSDTPQRTVHFTGRVRLTAQPPTGERDEPVPDGSPTIAAEDVYRLYFHGPAYQVVRSAWAHQDGAAGRLAEDLPPDHDSADGPTLIGPRLVELCFQTAGLVEAARDGVLALPLHVGRMSLSASPVEAGSLTAVTTRRPDGDGFDCRVVDDSGRVILRLVDYRTVPLPQPLPDEVRAPLRAALG
jgi:NAD(P)-dependent dehydrogenase (short-subunit alcohol dehydrogenase family)